ncbi:MAG: DUF1016 family protein [Neisseriaceae bacterium]|nr:DUF1016 family protein [Neisseriaceae bacterium]
MKNSPPEESLFNKISVLIEQSRSRIVTAINTAEVYTKYAIGQYIVEDEQHGQTRAKYGKQVLQDLSVRLTERFGKGWTVETLTLCRKLFLIYAPVNSVNTVCQIEENKEKQEVIKNTNFVNTVYEMDKPKFTLSWSHYLILMRIKNKDERRFYEIETQEQNWSVRQLQRQYNSSLYERLALSRDKEEIMRLATNGQIIEKSSDIIKDPLTLEFLGLTPDIIYTENKLENAIIGKMQQFLLELGKGFLFEARQKRFTFKEEHFFVDLVFYNRLLQCYVLIDLKVGKLTHQDLGQMQMYVNYYDRYVKQEYEKPSIGILLCKEKQDALVELTLPENSNIYASAYELYLPNKTLLSAKLQEWIEEFEQ